MPIIDVKTPTYFPLFLPSLGMGELAIIFVMILILFGPGKLPGVMKSMGEGIKQFKEATKEGSNPDNPSIEG